MIRTRYSLKTKVSSRIGTTICWKEKLLANLGEEEVLHSLCSRNLSCHLQKREI